MNEKGFLRVGDLAKRYGLRTGSLRRWRKQPDFPAPVVVYGAKLWPLAVIEGWEAAHGLREGQ